MDERTLLLWGDVGTGKTSLLATALLGPHADQRLPMIDWPASHAVVHDALSPAYERLMNCLPPVPTSSLPPGIVVHLMGGRGAVRLQDLMGEHARRPNQPVRELLGRAAGVLFVMAWGGHGRRRQFEAIRNALPVLGDRPRALAFTRCEQVLRDGHPAWEPGGERTDWWAPEDTWAPDEVDTLHRIGTVWPTSAFGFDGDGNPACVIDEFGDITPYDIRPVNGTALLGWLLERIAA
jgi:hypothetical protein